MQSEKKVVSVFGKSKQGHKIFTLSETRMTNIVSQKYEILTQNQNVFF